MGQFYSLLWDACGFWSLTNCGCGLQKKKKPHPAWVFLRKMPEKQLILFAWPYVCVQKKIVIEGTRDLIYLKFEATDFFPKIISLSADENSGDLA